MFVLAGARCDLRDDVYRVDCGESFSADAYVFWLHIDNLCMHVTRIIVCVVVSCIFRLVRLAKILSRFAYVGWFNFICAFLDMRRFDLAPHLYLFVPRCAVRKELSHSPPLEARRNPKDERVYDVFACFHQPGLIACVFSVVPDVERECRRREGHDI